MLPDCHLEQVVLGSLLLLILEQLQQLQNEIRQVKTPRIDETLSALESLTAGR